MSLTMQTPVAIEIGCSRLDAVSQTPANAQHSGAQNEITEIIKSTRTRLEASSATRGQGPILQSETQNATGVTDRAQLLLHGRFAGERGIGVGVSGVASRSPGER